MMMLNFEEVEGTKIDVGWKDYDSAEWRNHPDPADSELENDEEHRTAPDVVSILGFDPDAEDW